MKIRENLAPSNAKSGFSLVELSIVLVILGLLVGGVLSGQSLIRAAELRSVSADFQRYQAAVHTFRDKYFNLPGDMNTATSFWGKDNAACTGDSGTAMVPGTCNGDNDGIQENASVAGGTGERFQFWKQLALAGLIEGSYTGLAGSAAIDSFVKGVNAPASKIANSVWVTYTLSLADGGNANRYALDYGNWFIAGSNGPAILKPEEMWNIDTKLDDGKPATGKVVAFYWATCTTSTSFTDYAGVYQLTNSALGCNPLFRQAF